jgi:hypothetical protein
MQEKRYLKDFFPHWEGRFNDQLPGRSQIEDHMFLALRNKDTFIVVLSFVCSPSQDLTEG